MLYVLSIYVLQCSLQIVLILSIFVIEYYSFRGISTQYPSYFLDEKSFLAIKLSYNTQLYGRKIHTFSNHTDSKYLIKLLFVESIYNSLIQLCRSS